MNKRYHAPKRSRLSAALISALVLPLLAGQVLAQETDSASTASAEAQSTQAAATSGGTANLDKVTVVGSRIKRAEIEGPTPVTVITREDIDREGFQSVADMLQSLSQNSSTSFTGDLGVTGFSPNAQVVNLRNLGPGYTLVLINGRRPAMYPQPYNRDNNVVNTRAIPQAVVERVEVLAGGASAIYGSDAVAGVVNIVTRQNYDGNLVRLIAGTTTNGGGDTGGVELVGGKTGDRWSATWAFQYRNTEAVFADQRDWLADTRNGPLGPDFTNPALSLIMIRGLANANGPVNHNAYYPGAAACDALGFETRTTAARGTYCGSFTQPGSRTISNKSEYWSAYGYGTFDITDTTQAWASLQYYGSDAASSSGTEFWGTSGDRFNTTRTGSASAYVYNTSTRDLVQLQRVFSPEELGGPEAATTLYDESTYEVAGGVRGMFGDRFDWEAYGSYGFYDYTADRPRLLAQAVHDYFLGPRLGWASTTGVISPTGTYAAHNINLARWSAPITPEIYKSFATRVVNRSETTAATAGFNVSGDLFELPAGAVGFAGIMEWNRSTMDLVSDPRLDQLRPLDNQTVYNLTSSGETHGERDRYAVGAEFRIPIFDRLTAQAALRWDQYDDISSVDDAVTYNFGVEWRPLDSLLFRGSYATSFRAPDMQLIYAEGAASYAAVLDEYACRAGIGAGAAGGPRTRTQCNVTGDPTIYQTQTLIAGNAELKEEEGESWGAGLVWDITDNMSASLDYYRIKLTDAASQFSNDYLLQTEAACRLGTYSDGSAAPTASVCNNVYSLVTRESAPGTPNDQRVQRINSAYINTALTDTSGMDATYRWRYDTDRAGTFTTDLAYTLVLTNKYKQTADDDLIDYRDVAPNYSWTPQRSRVRGSVSWNYGDWTTTVFGTRLGSAYSNAAVDGTNTAGDFYSRRLPPYMLYNLTVAKKFGDNVQAELQVINVLDNQYREDNSFTAHPFYQPWIGADPLGRRLYMSLSWRF
ncbi:TonB-dependent receptor domain-containing protein [Pseudoxanthomonas daejeonensis]|uniref:TonB-dependent receptor n=1 Tax=Pseudoxanthomonas daejeonensis TaxID=266062 RepID=A0ABQ6Z8W0_9GAMM|nr:TonB-dependent receptor [Pseudoxanthomonas daejeonensis]KAF1695877.1 TonB-dependent receptor [Pseudoxanthomonas daejeonensis]